MTNPTSAGDESANTNPSDAEASSAHVFMEDTEEDIEWPAGKRLLYAMLDAGLDAPYGCTEGECGACQCVVEPHDNATRIWCTTMCWMSTTLPTT